MCLRLFFNILLSFLFIQSLLVYGSSDRINPILDQFEQRVLVEGKSEKESTEAFIADMVASNISLHEMRTWLESENKKLEFESVLNSLDQAEQIDSESLGQILAMTIKTNKTGAHFMGCKSGVILGSSLLVTAAVAAVYAIKNYQYNKNLQAVAEETQDPGTGEFRPSEYSLIMNNHNQYTQISEMEEIEGTEIDDRDHSYSQIEFPSDTPGPIHNPSTNLASEKPFKRNLIISIASAAVGTVSLYSGISKCRAE
jgi:hypothetical protein